MLNAKIKRIEKKLKEKYPEPDPDAYLTENEIDAELNKLKTQFESLINQTGYQLDDIDREILNA